MILAVVILRHLNLIWLILFLILFFKDQDFKMLEGNYFVLIKEVFIPHQDLFILLLCTPGKLC